MVKQKKKELGTKIMTNKGFFEREDSKEQETFEPENDEVKAIRRYIG